MLGYKSKNFAIFLLLIVVAACRAPDTTTIPSPVLIDDVVFPDEQLNECIKFQWRYSDLKVQYAHEVKSIVCDYEYAIESFIGLSEFHNLEHLLIRKALVETFDIAAFQQLQDFHLEGIVQSMNFSANPELTRIHLSSPRLVSVDLTGLTQLKDLSLTFGEESGAVSFGALPSLERLFIADVQDLNLDASNFPTLKYLRLHDVSTDVLDMRQLPALEELDLHDWSASGLDLSANSHLKRLDCYFCRFGTIAISPDNHLERLSLTLTDLQELTLATANALIELHLERNADLSQIELPAVIPALKVATLQENKLKELPASEWPSLEALSVYKNQIRSLSLQNMPKLTTLTVSDNQIANIDLHGAPNLTHVSLSHNQLEAVELPDSSQLSSIDLSSNRLTNLNLGAVPNLEHLAVADNFIVNIDLDNVPRLKSLNLAGNQLQAVEVAALVDLRSIDLARNQLRSLDLSSQTAIQSLNISQNKLSTLLLNPQVPLDLFDVSHNLLTELDLSEIAMSFNHHLSAANNRLTDFQFPRELTFSDFVDLSNNQLSSLTVDDGIFIDDINLSKNPLASLEVLSTFGNGYMIRLDISDTLLDCNRFEDLQTLDELVCASQPVPAT